ncbi:MAG: alpha/beta fold hydrolase [Actinomycetota bacterium]|nr:alpha/beta fold hydrolase [Actinomycetota bacterium]
MMTQDLPIVYVRGYAGTTSGINRAVDDPFYGFNLGSTHVRVGRKGDPIFYQFESPLLRLVLDRGYDLLVQGGQEQYLDRQPDESVTAKSIWIHRFYDVSASTWGERPQDFTLVNAAKDLLRLIKKIKAKTGAPRVHLVAHSMGGLICRCLVQKIIPESERGARAFGHVDRIFTYGTPHGGIVFDVGFGLIERLRDEFGFADADVFGPKRMYEYLTPGAEAGTVPPEGWSARDMPEDEKAFPLSRVFCLIGTNPQDYGAAFGASSKAVGAKSDGLVQIENAYVPGADHAFVHRSHSGRFGLVNSEEGYQNLYRFLFGDVKITADLECLPRFVLEGHDDIVWQAEVQLSVRGLPIVMAERVAAHHCPVQLLASEKGSADRPVPLVTTYLSTELSAHEFKRARYVLRLRILSLRQTGGVFGFLDHLEQSADFDDNLVVDVEPRDGRLVTWAKWGSEIPVTLREYEPQGDPLSDEDASEGAWRSRVPLPLSAGFLGGDTRISLTARPHS